MKMEGRDVYVGWEQWGLIKNEIFRYHENVNRSKIHKSVKSIISTLFRNIEAIIRRIREIGCLWSKVWE